MLTFVYGAGNTTLRSSSELITIVYRRVDLNVRTDVYRPNLGEQQPAASSRRDERCACNDKHAQ